MARLTGKRLMSGLAALMTNDSNIVIVSGGSFQGKSLIALNVATHFGFSGVITTDAIRNVMKLLNPGQEYLSTSTYLLSKHLLNKQMEEVSRIIRGLIGLYQARGEHIVIEGMHLSESFMKWSIQQGFLGLCTNNLLPLAERVILKRITRSRFRPKSDLDTGRMLGPINESNVSNTSYLQHKRRIDEITSDIVTQSEVSGFSMVEFDDIADGTKRAVNAVADWLLRGTRTMRLNDSGENGRNRSGD